jgi:7-carboxy-7-deazaguanine synthase
MSTGFLVQDRVKDAFPAPTPSGGPRLPVVSLAPGQRHRLKPLEGKAAGTLMIHEIYRSLQGESTFAGLPCVFIRLTACHLRCGYCDTPHAFAEGEVLDLDDVVARALDLGDDLVEVTGGEPLLQPEVYPLMARLADAGKTVLLETSGAIDIAAVDPRVRVILDIKTPGSGEVEANLWGNLERLKPTDEVKVVVCDRTDFDWAVDWVRHRGLTQRCPVLFSAAFGLVSPTDLAGWILESRLPVRLQLQQHKILWDPMARGV